MTLIVAAVPCFIVVIAVGFYLLARETTEAWLRQLGIGLLLYGFIFAALIVRQSSATWWLVGISLVMVVADSLLAQRKIFELGESFWPDLVRQLLAAMVMALIFAMPVTVAMATVTGISALMVSVLLATITLAIATQLLASPIQRLLDRIAFANRPQLQENRATLRATADALPRNDEALAVATVSDDEFARLTRRALSHLGDLPRLAASPLIRLPAVDRQLQEQGGIDNTLGRAAVLRDLLVESILQLKPDAGPATAVAFDNSDAWRHYNALYFPYVVGLKPYSRRTFHDNLDPATQQALAWFQAQVPERTLYNWQNGAARLVAQHLRELA